jgi:hypothetical protein
MWGVKYFQELMLKNQFTPMKLLVKKYEFSVVELRLWNIIKLTFYTWQLIKEHKLAKRKHSETRFIAHREKNKTFNIFW